MLNFSFPQAVEIAISIDSYCFIISQAEGDIGFVIGFQSLALPTVFGLDIDPLDEVFRKHRMIHAAHIDGDGIALYLNHRLVLLAAGFYGVGYQSSHFLTAAHHRNTCIMDHTHQIAAVFTDKKTLPPIFISSVLSIVFRTHFEECLRMLADRADLRSLGSYYDMSAVTTLPDGNAALLKYLHSLDVLSSLR